MSVDKVRSTLVILPVSLYIVSLGAGWLGLVSAAEILLVLLSIGVLLYVYWVPLTVAPIRDADGNPRFR